MINEVALAVVEKKKELIGTTTEKNFCVRDVADNGTT